MNTERPPDERGAGQRPWLFYPSPLRYPGGKRKLAAFVKLLLQANALVDGEYAEVYAGGAAIGLELLFDEYVRRIHINDLDAAVHAFWMAARDRTDELCARVSNANLTMAEWHRQRAVLAAESSDPMDLAFATLYLNRTNRSGILTGGPIGGHAQKGEWALDARFRRSDLIRRLERIGRFQARIEIYSQDGADFLERVAPTLPERSLVYLDPPYYVKGQEALYANYYRPADHERVARLVRAQDRPWMVSYDDQPEIATLYEGAVAVRYGIPYTAHQRYRGREVAFFAPSLVIPAVADPARVTPNEIASARAARP